MGGGRLDLLFVGLVRVSENPLSTSYLARRGKGKVYISLLCIS